MRIFIQMANIYWLVFGRKEIIMNINFEAIEKAWFKPKKNIIKEKLDLKVIKNL